MSSRERLSSTHQGRSIQTPGTMRHASFSETIPSNHMQLDRLSHSELLENKVAFQAAEIDRLSLDNRKLATSHVALREELISAEREVQRLKSHIGSITAETDIQIRVVSERIIKMDGVVKNGENIKRELQQAHIKVQNLVKERQELVSKIQTASEELQKACVDVRSMPELVAELESLSQEHKRLRAKFEREKGVNIEQVEQLKAMERTLMEMVRKIENLRTEIINAESKASAHAPCPPPLGYSSRMIPSAIDNPVWTGPYDPSMVQR